jgi:hypothetical protein
LSEDAVNRFATQLTADINDGISEMPPSAADFTRLVLERLEEAGHLDDTFVLYQEGWIGNAGYRIDGFAFDEDRARLDLFTTLYTAEVPPARLPAAEVARAFQRAFRFARACAEGLASRLEPSNTEASDLARRIEEQTSALATVRIVLLTDGIFQGSVPNSSKWKGWTIEYDAYDIVRLQRVLGEGETRADITVDLTALTGAPIPCLHIPSENGGYDAYLTVFPGDVLARAYDQYGVRLLELNVRAFLGVQGRKSVNSELRRTIGEQPSMFLAFNNGIVATVDDIELTSVQGSASAIRVLKGLQIVNGGQTTASLHRANRKESLSLASVAVPVKIIKVGGADLGEMVTSVSRAANRQNTVQLADFSANDPFHQQLETLANNTWLDDGKGRWFYERARGSYIAAEQKAAFRKSEQQAFRRQTPKQRRLTKLEMARYLSAWSGLPHRVCLGGQKNFQHLMQQMKNEGPPFLDAAWFKKLVASGILYRAVERTVRTMKFPAYGAQIVAYLVAGLSHRTGGRVDFARIWARQEVSPELEDLARTWAPLIDSALRESAGQRNPSEWYKKEECWKGLREHLPRLADPLPPELSHSETDPATDASALSPSTSVADYDRITRCMEVSGATWLEVAELGQRAGLVHWKVAGICRTLARYAAGGWERKPSAKQAKPALEALQRVELDGILSPGTSETARRNDA